MASGLFEYHSPDFTRLDSVELVSNSDSDVLNWKAETYGKKTRTPAGKRRLRDIRKFPEFFSAVVDAWNRCPIDDAAPHCINCVKYKVEKAICWNRKNKGLQHHPDMVGPDHTCLDFKRSTLGSPKCHVVLNQVREHPSRPPAICEGNFPWYLADIGLRSRPEKRGSRKAINAQYKFEKLVESETNAEFLPTVFKIKYPNKLGFKFMDMFLNVGNEHYIIVEYKAKWESSGHATQQINDYNRLLELTRTFDKPALKIVVIGESLDAVRECYGTEEPEPPHYFCECDPSIVYYTTEDEFVSMVKSHSLHDFMTPTRSH